MSCIRLVLISTTMVGLWLNQVATDESVQFPENSDVEFCKVKIKRNVCFLT